MRVPTGYAIVLAPHINYNAPGIIITMPGTRRPKANKFTISLIQTKILQYKKRYNETSLNAWKRLTRNKNFPTLMRQFYKGFKNKEYYLKRITEDNTAQNDFYKRHLVKDRSGIMHLLKTPSSKYTYRKKK